MSGDGGPNPRVPEVDYPVPSALPNNLTNSAGFMLSKAAHIVQVAYEAELKLLDMTVREFAVLQFIDSKGGESQQHIGNALGIDRTSMVAVVDRLEGLGLVARTRDVNDRRRYAVCLTPAGSRKLRDVLYPVDEKIMSWFTRGISEDDRQHLVRTLSRLVENR